MTEDHIAALDRVGSDYFTPREQAAILLAETLFEDPQAVVADREAAFQREFSAGELVELGWAIGQFIGLGKLIAFLGLAREDGTG